jgi:hypothetical protein
MSRSISSVFRVLNQERLIQPANPPTSGRERSYHMLVHFVDLGKR